MLMRGGMSLDAEEKKMLRLFRTLGREQQQTVADFVAFLAGKQESASTLQAAQPVLLPKPEQESVVRAIKRLRASYPMLDQNSLFHETSAHMTEHLLHGKPAAEVINELEIMFSSHYQRYLEGVTNPGE